MHNRQDFIGIGRNDRGRFFMSVTVFDAYVVSDLVKETVPTSTLPFSTGADLEVGSDWGELGLFSFTKVGRVVRIMVS